jgi:3-oxoacyl-ACP reductase-like protein
VTEKEVFDNAWECARVALYNLSYESADVESLSYSEIKALTHQLTDIATWFDSQKETCWQEHGLKKGE